MIEWTTLYVDPGDCTCLHDHGAKAIDENTTQYATVKCPDAACTDDCRPQLETVQIPAGSNGPVLVRVDRASWPKSAAESKSAATGRLPSDFPGRDDLEAEGINTFGQLRKVDDLTSIAGIGPATAEKIAAALEEADAAEGSNE